MKEFTTPELEAKRFSENDIITTSDNPNTGGETQQSELRTEGVSLGSVNYIIW